MNIGHQRAAGTDISKRYAKVIPWLEHGSGEYAVSEFCGTQPGHAALDIADHEGDEGR